MAVTEIVVEVRRRNVEATFGPNSQSLAGGVTGPPGPPGSSLLHGTVDPGAGIGRGDDFYVNLTTWQIFGPKTGGAWGGGTDIIGPQGLAGTIEVGTVTTGAPGSDVEVENVGTASEAVLNFTIPEGIQGIQGIAATIAVGTVTTVAPGQPATVTNSGSAEEAVFDFEIPEGDVGATGPESWAVPVDWTTATAYTATPPRSAVVQNGETYVCLISHTSGTFSTDLAASRWKKVAAKGADGAGTGTVLPTGSPSAGQLARFADGSGNLIEGVGGNAPDEPLVLDSDGAAGAVAFMAEGGTFPNVQVRNTDAAANKKTFRFGIDDDGDVEFQFLNDAGSTAITALTIARDAAGPGVWTFVGTGFEFPAVSVAGNPVAYLESGLLDDAWVPPLPKARVGLDQVANLAPADLPISDDTQAALDALEDLISSSSDTASSDMFMRLMLAISELKANQYGTPNGIADDFSDADGISALTNMTFNSGSKLVASNAVTIPLCTGNTGNSDGSIVSASSVLTGGTLPAWKGFDGTTVGTSNGWCSENTGGPWWLRRQFTSGKIITSYGVTASNHTGNVAANVGLTPTAWTLRGSNDGSSWTTLDTVTGQTGWAASERRVFTVDSPGSYTYYEILITAVQAGTNTYAYIGELDFTAVPGAATAASVSFAALAAPTRANFMLIAKASGAFTLNTDLVAALSRNGGTDYTNITLAQRETLAGGYVVYEALDVDISATPSGSSMRWRVQGAAGVTWEFTAISYLWN